MKARTSLQIPTMVLTSCFARLSLVATESPSPSHPMSSMIGLEQQTISERFSHFYTSLYTPTVPTFDEVESADVRERARRGVAGRIVRAYEELYDRISDPASMYDQPEKFLTMNPQEINALLV